MASLSDVTRQFMDDYRKAHPKGDSEALWKRLMLLERKFKAADSDGSGDMDLEEIVKALSELGRSKTKQQMKDLVSLVDDDNSGTLRFREFINLMLIEEGFIKDPIDEVEDASRRASRPGRRLGRGNRPGAFKRKKRGHLELETKIVEKDGKIVLSVKIIAGKDLLPCDLNGLSDPYVKLYVEPDPVKSTKQKTKVQKKTLNPTFNEEFTWTFPKTKGFSLKNRRLLVSVWDWDRLSRNDFMGAFAFDLEDIMDPMTNTSGWFILLDETQGAVHAFPSKTNEVSGAPSPVKRTASVVPPSNGLGGDAKESTSLTPESFDFHMVLGKGSFGKVFLVTPKKQPKKCLALKVLKKASVVREDDVDATLTEKHILTMQGCPFLVHCVASFQSPGNLYFVMELVEGGDLMHHAMEKSSFSVNLTTFFTAEIAAGLMFLHEHGIIYRDLKLDNVMLDATGHVKIADFGLCKADTPIGKATTTFCGTPNYLAPEVVQYKPYTHAVDWWSLGVIVFEMLNGYTLFDGDSEEELYTAILRQRISMPRTMSAPAQKFVANCLVRNPKERLGFGTKEREQITSHPFFKLEGKQIDFAKLEKKQYKPPFKPTVKDPKDGANFDPEFTALKPVVSVTAREELDTIDQNLFAGFSFTEPGLV